METLGRINAIYTERNTLLWKQGEDHRPEWIKLGWRVQLDTILPSSQFILGRTLKQVQPFPGSSNKNSCSIAGFSLISLESGLPWHIEPLIIIAMNSKFGDDDYSEVEKFFDSMSLHVSTDMLNLYTTDIELEHYGSFMVDFQKTVFRTH